MKDTTRQTDRPLLKDCHCFNLRRATLAITALYDRHMENAGVTVQQFCALRHIRDAGSLSVTELSKRIGLDRTTLSRNLTLLERRGLLATQPSHGRQRRTALTLEGEKILDLALSHWRTAQQEVEARLGAERMETLEELLNLLLTAK